MALGEQAPKSLAIRAPKVLVLLDGPAAGDPLVRLLAGDLALEQGEQPDALGSGPGSDRHGRAGPQRRRAAADRGRERGRRPPVAQRADDDRERAEPGGKDGAARDGPAARHRLPEPGPAARGQPAARPPGRSHAIPALRGRPVDRDRHDPRQGHLPHRDLSERADRPAPARAQDPLPAGDACGSTSSCSNFSATGFTWRCCSTNTAASSAW